MLMETTLVKRISLNTKSNETLNFENGISFMIKPDKNLVTRYEYQDNNRHKFRDENSLNKRSLTFFLTNVEGDFKFIKIVNSLGNDVEIRSTSGQDKQYNFEVLYNNDICIYMHFLTKVNLEKVNFVEVPYRLQVSAARMKPMKEMQYLEDPIILANYDSRVLKYYIKKVGEHFVEVYIVNPYKIHINGEKTDYRCILDGDKDINLSFTFVFDPNSLANPQI